MPPHRLAKGAASVGGRHSRAIRSDVRHRPLLRQFLVFSHRENFLIAKICGILGSTGSESSGPGRRHGGENDELPRVTGRPARPNSLVMPMCWIPTPYCIRMVASSASGTASMQQPFDRAAEDL